MDFEHENTPNYSMTKLAEMVNEKCNSPLYLEWFVYELSEINEKFKEMIDSTNFGKIYRIGWEIKQIIENTKGLDELDYSSDSLNFADEEKFKSEIDKSEFDRDLENMENDPE